MIKDLFLKSILTKDDKGRNILYIESKNLAYLLQEKDLKKYNLYKNRYILVLVAIALISSFNVSILYCIIAGILSILLLEYNYRNKFLNSLSKVTKFKYNNKNESFEKNEKDNNKNLILAILYFIFGILFFINGIINNPSSVSNIFNLIILIACTIISIVKIKEFIMNKK